MARFNISSWSISLLVSITLHAALWYNLSLPGKAYSYPEQSQTIEISLLPKLPQPAAVTPPPKKIVARAVTPTRLKPAVQAPLPVAEPEPITEPDTTTAQQLAKAMASQPEAPRYTASYLDNPPPSYPLAARRRNIEGKIVVRAEVQVDGSCGQVELKTASASELLNQAALDAVRKWRFVPATLDGEMIVAWVEIPITFKLNN